MVVSVTLVYICQVRYLGHAFAVGGMKPDSIKNSAVSEWPVTKKSVRRQNRSARTNFGSQNWSPFANFGPPLKMYILI